MLRTWKRVHDDIYLYNALRNLLAAPLQAPVSGLSLPIAGGPGPSPSPSSHLIDNTGLRPLLVKLDKTSSGPHKAARYGGLCADVQLHSAIGLGHAPCCELQVRAEREGPKVRGVTE